MTSPAVVILTDPARCQLADADVLLKALLQVQQLSDAGVPASQAFCDHPAAARKFVDAYSKAYPELQQQSSDLPLPEHLYSMVADGRFGPLVAPATGEPTKLGESAQLYPLYVLSLGAPEALMQALQHSSLAKSNIRVLEIAPIEQPSTESVPVAEAVAHEPAARSSWLAESPSGPQEDDEEALSSDALPAGQPVKLDSVEVNLDHIQADRDDEKANFAQDDPPLGRAEPAIVQIVPAGTGNADADVLRPSHLSEPAPAGNLVALPEIQPAPAAVAALAPAQETFSTLPSEPAVVTGPAVDTAGSGPDAVAPADDGRTTGDGASPPDGSADGEQTSSNPPDDGPHDEIPAADSSGVENVPRSSALPAPEQAPAAESGPAAEEDPIATHPSSFSDPGEDVHYPSTGSFAWGDDLPYALPPELVPDADLFEDLFGVAAAAEVVDLEAFYGDLKASAGASIPAVEKLDLSLLRALQSGGADSSELSASPPMSHESLPRYRETPDPGQDEAHDQGLTTVHDTDL